MHHHSNRIVGNGLAGVLGALLLSAPTSVGWAQTDAGTAVQTDATASVTGTPLVRVIHLHQESAAVQQRYGYSAQQSEPPMGTPKRGLQWLEDTDPGGSGHGEYLLTHGALDHSRLAVVGVDGQVSEHCVSAQAEDILGTSEQIQTSAQLTDPSAYDKD